MRLFTTQKAQEITTSKVFYWLFGLIVAVALVYSMWGFGASYTAALTATPQLLQQDLIISRITNTCFSLQEQITPLHQTTTPLLIDLSKVSNQQLATCFTGEGILPYISVVVTSLQTPVAFTPHQAFLAGTSSPSILPEQLLTTKTVQATHSRLVLAKDKVTTKFCGLCPKAIPQATKQQDRLFFAPVILTEEDYKAIENYIKDLDAVEKKINLQGYATPEDALLYPTLLLSSPSNHYNNQPKLSDFCFSKEGDCTYNEFITDYEGDCQIRTVLGKTTLAEIVVKFYE